MGSGYAGTASLDERGVSARRLAVGMGRVACGGGAGASGGLGEAAATFGQSLPLGSRYVFWAAADGYRLARRARRFGPRLALIANLWHDAAMQKHATTNFYRMRLPHWEVDRGRYFITCRTAGSLPRSVYQQLKADSDAPQPPTGAAWRAERRRIFRMLDAALDDGRECAHFSQPAIAETCSDAIAHREETGVWTVFEYVIMPNHVHLFIGLEGIDLYEAIVSFKRWTARSAAPLAGIRPHQFWQREWFDHWSRNTVEDEKICEYIRANPVKAGLVSDYRDWPYGSWAKR